MTCAPVRSPYTPVDTSVLSSQRQLLRHPVDKRVRFMNGMMQLHRLVSSYVIASSTPARAATVVYNSGLKNVFNLTEKIVEIVINKEKPKKKKIQYQ